MPADARREHSLLDRAREVCREGVSHAEVPVGVALPGAAPQRAIGAREERVDRPLRDLDRLAVDCRRGGCKHDIAVDEGAVDRKRAGEGIGDESQYLLDLRRTDVPGTADEVSDVVLVDDHCGLGRRPVMEQLLAQSEHLRVDEGGRGRHPGLGGLGAA